MYSYQLSSQFHCPSIRHLMNTSRWKHDIIAVNILFFNEKKNKVLFMKIELWFRCIFDLMWSSAQDCDTSIVRVALVALLRRRFWGDRFERDEDKLLPSRLWMSKGKFSEENEHLMENSRPNRNHRFLRSLDLHSNIWWGYLLTWIMKLESCLTFCLSHFGELKLMHPK